MIEANNSQSSLSVIIPSFLNPIAFFFLKGEGSLFEIKYMLNRVELIVKLNYNNSKLVGGKTEN